MFEYMAYTEKGSKRQCNEDRILISNTKGNTILSEGLLNGETEGPFLALICDGAGGTNGGQIAAEIAAGGFIGFDIASASPLSLYSHIHSINDRIRDEQRCLNNCPLMAAAAAGIMFLENRFMLFHLGDSRIYEMQNGFLVQKTRDHTLACERGGWNTSASGPARNMLTRYFGGSGHARRSDIMKGFIKEDESLFLLCSDGVHQKIPVEALERIMADPSALEEKKRAIMNLSIQNGSADDKSLVLIQYRKRSV